MSRRGDYLVSGRQVNEGRGVPRRLLIDYGDGEAVEERGEEEEQLSPGEGLPGTLPPPCPRNETESNKESIIGEKMKHIKYNQTKYSLT